jgi:hypothetical protein
MDEIDGDPAIEVRVIRISRQADDRRSPANYHLIRVADVKRPAISQLQTEWLEWL